MTGRNPDPTGYNRPGAARGDADAESGQEGAPADSKQRQLMALDVMFERGLIPEIEYRRRRAAILGAREGG